MVKTAASENSIFNLLTMVSHELRTPLTAIMGYADIISSEGIEDPLELKRCMAVIHDSAQSQAKVINDLLDASFILTNHLDLSMKPLDLVPVAEESLAQFRPQAARRNLRFHVTMGMSRARVLGDQRRLEQVFESLLSNAVKFSLEGGLIHFEMILKDHFVEVSVTDEGIGIDPAFQSKIFDIFVQADSSLTRKYGGLGLGLSITKYLVETHGGNISVDSAGINRGSQFKFRLPLFSEH
jgi:signal transduction histidine kinase